MGHSHKIVEDGWEGGRERGPADCLGGGCQVGCTYKSKKCTVIIVPYVAESSFNAWALSCLYLRDENISFQERLAFCPSITNHASHIPHEKGAVLPQGTILRRRGQECD